MAQEIITPEENTPESPVDSPKHATLLFHAKEEPWVRENLLPQLASVEVQLFALSEPCHLPELAETSLVLTWLSDEALQHVLPEAAARQWEVGLLPHAKMTQARLGFGVAAKVEHAVEDALKEEAAQSVDLLYCNDVPVFNAVAIGHTYSLKSARVSEDNVWQRAKRFFTLVPNLKTLHLRAFDLLTRKEKNIDTAALGIVVVEHGRSSPLARRIIDDSQINDGMLHALVLAPRSVVEFLSFLFVSIFLPARSARQLPSFVGHIKTESISLSSDSEFEYSLDGVVGRAEKLELRVVARCLKLRPCRHLNTKGTGSSKESYKIQALPVGEARRELVAHPMPWIHHAAPEEFKELFLTLRENARASEAFLVLMVLSTLLATVGLFASSAPVIIGAMILAPLMSPIVSLAMGVLRQDEKLISESTRTLGVGIGLALLFATLMTLLTPLQSINAEIAARLSPTLLDLAVAVISGIAGAYAHARAEVARSLAGVAIAVALVPPLAVTGIGIGWLDWAVFSGALLLFLTNLAGIVLAAALTFLLLGYSAFHRARRGLFLSLILVMAVSVPLALGFNKMVAEHRVKESLEGWMIEGVTLKNISVTPGSPLQLQIQLASPSPLAETQLDHIKQAIEQRLGESVSLEAVIAIVR